MSDKVKPTHVTTIKLSYAFTIDRVNIAHVEERLKNLIEDMLRSYTTLTSFTVEEISTERVSPRQIIEEAGITEIPEEGFPEGIEYVKYTFMNDKDISTIETLLEAASVGKADLRSAVNIGNMVRTVMYSPPDDKTGTAVMVAVTDKDMAWHLQQLMDWVHNKQIKILALRREGLELHVAFRIEGIQPPPKPKVLKWFHGVENRNRGWRMIGEPK